jgi:tetratricopeptide (TPR) repeat protein
MNYPTLKVALVVAVLTTLMAPGVVSADGSANASPDQIQLVSLAPIDPRPETSIDTIRLRAVVRYTLASVQQGAVLMFAFENGQSAATSQTQLGSSVTAGSGGLQIDFDYTPSQDVHQVSFLASLLQDDQHLLAWVSTDSMDVAQWQARAAFLRAMAARRGSDFSSALDDLNFALQLSPDSGNLLYWRADTNVHLQQYDAAVSDFSDALRVMPGDQPSLVGRGISYVWQQDWPDAIADLSPVADASDQSGTWVAPAHRARGLAYAGMGNPASAIADYQAYLSLRPNATDRDQVQGWISSLSAQ